MKLNFGQEVLVLPASVLSHLDAATPEQLRVLLWLASDASLASKPAQLAKLADTDRATLTDALQFWKSCGVLTEDGEALSEPIAKSTKKKTSEIAEKPTKKPRLINASSA